MKPSINQLQESLKETERPSTPWHTSHLKISVQSQSWKLAIWQQILWPLVLDEGRGEVREVREVKEEVREVRCEVKEEVREVRGGEGRGEGSEV